MMPLLVIGMGTASGYLETHMTGLLGAKRIRCLLENRTNLPPRSWPRNDPESGEWQIM